MTANQVQALRDAAEQLIRAVQEHFDPICKKAVPRTLEALLVRTASAVFEVDAEMARDGSGRFVQARPSGNYLSVGAQTVLARALLSAVLHANDPSGMDPVRDWEEASKSGTRCLDTLRLAGVVLQALQRSGAELQLGRRVG